MIGHVASSSSAVEKDTEGLSVVTNHTIVSAYRMTRRWGLGATLRRSCKAHLRACLNFHASSRQRGAVARVVAAGAAEMGDSTLTAGDIPQRLKASNKARGRIVNVFTPCGQTAMKPTGAPGSGASAIRSGGSVLRFGIQ